MNRTLNQSKLNYSKLNQTKNQTMMAEEPSTITQGWQEIEQLRKENKVLREEIEGESKIVKNNKTQEVSRIQKDEKSLIELERIQDQSVQLATQIELESKKNRDLSELILILKEELEISKLELTKADGNALPQLQSKFRQLEYQLEKTRGKQNNSQAQIGKYKELLNNARRERVIYSNVFKKLESDLKKKEEEFKKLILETFKEEKKKEQYEEEYQNLRQNAKQEIAIMHKKYEDAIEEIRDELETDKQQIRENNQKIFGLSYEFQDSTIMQNNESQVATFSPKTQSRVPNKHLTGVIDMTQHEVDHYNFVFEKLKKQSGCESLDEFIYQFKNIDNQNEELYSECNMKLDEIFELRKKVQDLDIELEKQNAEQEKNNQRIEELKLHKKGDAKKKMKENIKQTTSQNEQMATDIYSCKDKIHTLTKLLNINIENEGLLSKSGIELIGEIEKKIGLIVNMHQYCSRQQLNIERNITINSQPTDEKDKEINEWLNKMSKKDIERIHSRNDMEEIAIDAIKELQKKKKGLKL